MIHGLDEPAKPKFHPVYGEGMSITDGGQACRHPSTSTSSSHDDENPVDVSHFSYSPDNPLSPFSPPPRGNPARQGLSFQILQILYDSDEEKNAKDKLVQNVQKDRMNSTADENDWNSSYSSSDGGSRRSSSSMSPNHPLSPGMISHLFLSEGIPGYLELQRK